VRSYVGVSIIEIDEQETLMDMVRKCCLKDKRPEGRFPIAYSYPPPLNGLYIIKHECGKKSIIINTPFRIIHVLLQTQISYIIVNLN